MAEVNMGTPRMEDDVIEIDLRDVFRKLVKHRLLLITVLVIACLMAASAHAQVVSSGPSLSFLELRPGYSQPVQIAAGAGYQLSVGFFPTTIANEDADLLDLGGVVFGSLVTNPTGTQAGSLSAGLFVGTLNEVIAIGIAEDIISSSGGFFTLPPYGCLWFNPLKLAFGSPPVSSGGVASPRRWLTSYLGL